jgi:hypothetical protein
VVVLLGDERERQACAQRVVSCRHLYTWERALDPLLRYCEDPWFAADIGGRRDSRRNLPLAGKDLQPPRGLVGRTLWFMRKEGPLALFRRPVRKARRELAAFNR